MAIMADATQATERANWTIDKDSFAPPPTRRTVRGWDRAPVSAHAPRLHGQKVWKKAAHLTRKMGDDSNVAQHELETEGAGARKKSRTLGAKENITNAAWVEHLSIGNGNEPHTVSTISPVGVLADVTNLPGTPHTTSTPAKIDMDSAAFDLQFVPRKRTNTNHVITPKKIMRQTTLNSQAQRESLLELPKDGMRRRARKSMRKSIRESTIGVGVEHQAAILVSQTFTGQPKGEEGITTNGFSGIELREAVAEPMSTKEKSRDSGFMVLPQVVSEPASRRKSVRRSTRPTRASIAKAEQPMLSRDASLSLADITLVNVSKEAAACLTVSDSAQEPALDELMLEAHLVEPSIDAHSHATAGVFKSPKSSSVELEKMKLTDSSLLRIATIDGNSDEDLQNAPEDVHKAKKAAPKRITSEDGSGIIEVSETVSAEHSHESINVDEAHESISVQIKSIHKSAEVSEPTEPLLNITSLSTIANADPLSLESSKSQQVDIPDTKEQPSTTQLHPGSIVESIEEVPDDSTITESLDVGTSTATTTNYDHDDTDMLRNFLTRVKANKAAKKASPKRKRSLPHSPLRIPLGEMDNNLSPLSLEKGDFDLTAPSPSRRKKKGSPVALEDDSEEPKSCRRSTRTRLPVKSGGMSSAPSLIPMRRLGQDDTTVTLKRSEEKELAALTRVNTRKNKGAALTALEVLTKKGEEKEDPAMRQRLLKEVFDMKIEQGKEKKAKGKNVTWASELAQFQTMTKGKLELRKDNKEKEKIAPVEEKKQSAVRVGVRSKMALGMAVNGTPAPKRKMRGRS